MDLCCSYTRCHGFVLLVHVVISWCCSYTLSWICAARKRTTYKMVLLVHVVGNSIPRTNEPQACFNVASASHKSAASTNRRPLIVVAVASSLMHGVLPHAASPNTRKPTSAVTSLLSLLCYLTDHFDLITLPLNDAIF